jgi:hypothetical protein
MDINLNPIVPVPPPPVEQKPPEAPNHIIGINFLIFLAYYAVGFAAGKASPNSSLAGLVMYGYMYHFAVLVVIALVVAFTKRRSTAWLYLATAFMLLVIGFGACTFAFSQGAFGTF